jgi:hypothetical protein
VVFLLLRVVENPGFGCFFRGPDEGLSVESVSDWVSLVLALVFIRFFTPASS